MYAVDIEHLRLTESPSSCYLRLRSHPGRYLAIEIHKAESENLRLLISPLSCYTIQHLQIRPRHATESQVEIHKRSSRSRWVVSGNELLSEILPSENKHNTIESEVQDGAVILESQKIVVTLELLSKMLESKMDHIALERETGNDAKIS